MTIIGLLQFNTTHDQSHPVIVIHSKLVPLRTWQISPLNWVFLHLWMLKAPPLIPRTYIFLLKNLEEGTFFQVPLLDLNWNWNLTVFRNWEHILGLYFRTFSNIFLNILPPICQIYFGRPRNLGLRNKRGCLWYPTLHLLVFSPHSICSCRWVA